MNLNGIVLTHVQEQKPTGLSVNINGLFIPLLVASAPLKAYGQDTSSNPRAFCHLCREGAAINRDYCRAALWDVIVRAYEKGNLLILPEIDAILCEECIMAWEMSYRAIMSFLEIEHLKGHLVRKLNATGGVVWFRDEAHYDQFRSLHGESKDWAIFHEFAILHKKWKEVVREVRRLNTVGTGLMYDR